MKINKIISAILVLSLCMSITITASANDHPVPIDGTDYTLIKSNLEAVKNAGSANRIGGFSGAREATAEQIAESAKQVDKNLAINDSLIVQKAVVSSTWNTLPSFVYYAQELNYSCGAAAVKMALKYLTGSTYAESTIRTGVHTSSAYGTYLSDMVSYINTQQSKNNYVSVYGASKSSLQLSLYNGIVYWDTPPIVGLRESTSNGWAFNLSGHFVTIYAVMSDYSNVSLCDPWAGYVSSSSAYKFVNKSTDDVYTAYNAVNIGYMY